MASLIQTMQLAGYPSVANTGNPSTGSGLLGTASLEYWSDGSIVITNASGKRIRVDENRQLNNLFDQILKGINGLSTTKTFPKAS